MAKRRDLIVGLVFLGAVIGVGYLTVVIKGFSYLTRPRIAPLKIVFDDVLSLEEGEEVRVRGVKIGQVTGISYNKSGKVVVEATLFEEPVLYKNVSFHIRSKSPLGGWYLAIDPGSPSDPAHPEKDRVDLATLAGMPLHGETPADLFTELGRVLGEKREALAAIIDDLRDAVGAIRRREGVVGALIYDEKMKKDLTGAVHGLSVSVTEPRGLLYALLQNRELADNVTEAVASLRKSLTRTDTPLGVLLNDPEAGRSVRQALVDLSEIASQIRSGKGTVGRLLADEKLYDEAVRAAEGLSALVQGEGLVPYLIKDPESRELGRRSLEALRDVALKLNTGKGTIPRLLNEPDVYEHAEKLLVEIRESVEDAREAAPINQLVNLLGAVY